LPWLGAVDLLEADRLDEVKLRFDEATMLKGLADSNLLAKLDALAQERAAAEAGTVEV
jgi:hypothetical protein